MAIRSIGVVGAVLSAICCFTPFLPWFLGIVGLSAYLDYVYRDDLLFSVLALSLVLIGIDLWRRKRRAWLSNQR
jgi:mercuric ion transport protein